MYKCVFGFFITFFLAGCSENGRTMILSAPIERYAARTFTFVHGHSTIPCDEEVKGQFETDIREGLADINMGQGNDLIIEYRCVQCEEGNRLVRCLSAVKYVCWVIPSSAGEAALTIEVIFKDKSSRELSKIYVSGKNNSGFFKGGFNHAVEQAAQQVIQYVTTHFHQ